MVARIGAVLHEDLLANRVSTGGFLSACIIIESQSFLGSASAIADGCSPRLRAMFASTWPPPKLVCAASVPPSVRRTAQYLNSGILRERVERGVGQPVDRRLVVAERHEHRAARRAVVGARVQRDARRGATRSSPRRPGCRRARARSSGWTSATGSGSSASSTVARRVMLPVCQCSSWRPVMSTIGYSASGRSSAGMMSAGTKLRPAALAREGVDEDDRLARVAFLRARIGDGVLALEPFPGDAGDARHRVAHLVEHDRDRVVAPRQAHALARSAG